MGVIRSFSDLQWKDQLAARGGKGPSRGAPYLVPGDMLQVAAAGRTVLEPGSSVGEHGHPDTEELYLILEGEGTASLDGDRFPVKAGDLFVVKAGHAHGLENDSDRPLSFFGLITSGTSRQK